MSKISIILPTLNESENIIPLIKGLTEEIHKSENGFEIIVVDDNSPDGTSNLVREYSLKNPEVKLICRKDERGLTSAINCGILKSTGDIVVWMDCDFSHPPQMINELIWELEEKFDATIASRYVGFGADKRDGPLLQPILSLLISKLTVLLTRVQVKDVTSGYIAIKHKALMKVFPLVGDYGEYFIDMVCRLHKVNTKIKEVPYILKNRELGESKTATSTFGLFRRGRKYLATLLNHLQFRQKVT